MAISFSGVGMVACLRIVTEDGRNVEATGRVAILILTILLHREKIDALARGKAVFRLGKRKDDVDLTLEDWLGRGA